MEAEDKEIGRVIKEMRREPIPVGVENLARGLGQGVLPPDERGFEFNQFRNRDIAQGLRFQNSSPRRIGGRDAGAPYLASACSVCVAFWMNRVITSAYSRGFSM